MNDKNHLPVFGVGPLFAVVCGALTLAAVLLRGASFAAGGLIEEFRLPFIMVGIVCIITGAAVWFCAVIACKIDEHIVSGKLVTTGVYAWVRNPIYAAFMLVYSGVLFISGNVFFLPLILFFWLFLTVLMMCTEELWLEKKYGSEYVAYKKKVNRCFPWYRG